MAVNLGMLVLCARMVEPVSIRNVASQTFLNEFRFTGPDMSKQLTLSATVAVLTMAVFAFSTSIGENVSGQLSSCYLVLI